MDLAKRDDVDGNAPSVDGLESSMTLLEAAHGEDLVVGCKAASLGWMFSAGLSVPQGFILTSGAYRAFAGGYQLQAKIERLLSGVDFTNPAQLAERAAQVRQIIFLAPLPLEFKLGIAQRYAAMDGGRVAVRLSQAHETPDAYRLRSPRAALNIEGAGSVAEAVRGCWASLFQPWEINYRHRMGLPLEDIQCAVLVQRMVRSDVSGVMFTRHGPSGSIRIEAVCGIGETLLEQELTRDCYVLDRDTMTVVQRDLAEQPWMLAASTKFHGVSERLRLPAERRLRQKLSITQLGSLAAIGLMLERRYAKPQEIEFAVEDGALHLLQVRDMPVP